jgi:hypothetical protein
MLQAEEGTLLDAGAGFIAWRINECIDLAI